MSQIKILIVEDNMIVAADIAATLSQIGYGVSGMLTRGEDVVGHIRNHRPDIILMDINLQGEMDGIQASQKILDEYQLPVIFLTANADKLTFERAKETQPYAFILKPFDRFDLEHSIELAISRFAGTQPTASPAAPAPSSEPAAPETHYLLGDRIFVKSRDGLTKIYVDDIFYIEADNNYCFLHTQHKRHLVTVNLKTMEEKLRHPNFLRVHRSFIINIDKLDKVGELYLTLNQKEIPISKSYRPELMKRLQMI